MKYHNSAGALKICKKSKFDWNQLKLSTFFKNYKNRNFSFLIVAKFDPRCTIIVQ